jgi:hypothetical protein
MEKGVIKGVLAEELENSIRMKKGYEKTLKKLPKGCLSVKKIHGHEYCYLVTRVGKKLKYEYKGKLSNEERNEYQKIKKERARYRKLLSQVNKQIKYLKGTLRGKEAV